MADATGFDLWRKELNKAARQAAFAQCVEEGQAIAAHMKATAPLGKTGRLRDSVRMEADAGRGVVRIKAGGPLTTVPVRKGQSATYDYSLAVEFGTQKASAHPFFWPIWRHDRTPAKKKINQAIRSAVEALNSK